MRYIIFMFVLSVISFTSKSQNFGSIKAKEQFDAFNAVLVNNISPCTINPNLDGDDFGDGQSFILDGYVNMYKTTKDKAYLYKFMLEAMCVMENRHDGF